MWQTCDISQYTVNVNIYIYRVQVICLVDRVVRFLLLKKCVNCFLCSVFTSSNLLLKVQFSTQQKGKFTLKKLSMQAVHLSRGSYLHIALRRVCNQDQESWSMKIILGRLIVPFQYSWSLDLQGFKGQNLATPQSLVSEKICRTIDLSSLSCSLDWLLQGVLILIWSQSQMLL